MAFANSPQYAIGGARNAQSVNSIPNPSPGRTPTRFSAMRSIRASRGAGQPSGGISGGPFPRGRSQTRPDVVDNSQGQGSPSATDDRGFSAVPSRRTGGIAARTNARPASENSAPPFIGSGSNVGAASSPLRSGMAPSTKFTSPGTEQSGSAIAAGNASMKRSTAASGTPVGPFGKRNGTGARSPRGFGSTHSRGNTGDY